MRRARSIACCGFLLLLGACGGDHGAIDAAGARALAAEVAAARTAAAHGDASGTASGLLAIKQTVAALRTRHEISDERAKTVIAAVADVEAALKRTTTSTTTSVAPTTKSTPPTVTAPGPARGKKHRKNDDG